MDPLGKKEENLHHEIANLTPRSTARAQARCYAAGRCTLHRTHIRVVLCVSLFNTLHTLCVCVATDPRRGVRGASGAVTPGGPAAQMGAVGGWLGQNAAPQVWSAALANQPPTQRVLIRDQTRHPDRPTTTVSASPVLTHVLVLVSTGTSTRDRALHGIGPVPTGPAAVRPPRPAPLYRARSSAW